MSTSQCGSCSGFVTFDPQLAGQLVQCPHCRNPFRMEPFLPKAAPMQVELTAKRFKLQQLIGLAIFVLGALALSIAILMSASSSNPSLLLKGFMLFSILITAGGLIYYTIARFQAWWQHG